MSNSNTYYHIGFLVADIEASMEVYSKLFGTQFRAPASFALSSILQSGGTENGELRASYSMGGPPYYELIEAVGNGMFAATEGLGFHHIGVWMDDAQTTYQDLEQQHAEVEGTIAGTDSAQPVVIYSRPSVARPVRMEYVNRRYQSAIQRFIDTGIFSED